jgi:hypothetical protein
MCFRNVIEYTALTVTCFLILSIRSLYVQESSVTVYNDCALILSIDGREVTSGVMSVGGEERKGLGIADGRIVLVGPVMVVRREISGLAMHCNSNKSRSMELLCYWSHSDLVNS